MFRSTHRLITFSVYMAATVLLSVERSSDMRSFLVVILVNWNLCEPYEILEGYSEVQFEMYFSMDL